ncbi:septum formation family protein [Gulosibacter bifidus]|uniref:Septum formation family protein n=1 Tax=Gulosibacter bifidus TaxID=272239 RepID=A0ABW5RK60_9MICO|nr:septum formation family protein [Gulosibacter bifidus]
MEFAGKKRATAIIAALAAAGLFLTGCANGNERTDDDKQSQNKKSTNETTQDEGGFGFGDDTPVDTGGDSPFEEPEDQNVFDIKLGDCITDAAAEGEVQSLPTVACSQPHSYEVFHEFDLTGDKFPGESGMEADILDQCYGKPFEDFIGKSYDSSSLDVLYLSPTATSWAQGDRRVSCLVFEGDGTGNKTTGSLKGSKL